jgi:hypothetical protein
MKRALIPIIYSLPVLLSLLANKQPRRPGHLALATPPPSQRAFGVDFQHSDLAPGVSLLIALDGSHCHSSTPLDI